jgi:hypothetical protein
MEPAAAASRSDRPPAIISSCATASCIGVSACARALGGAVKGHLEAGSDLGSRLSKNSRPVNGIFLPPPVLKEVAPREGEGGGLGCDERPPGDPRQPATEDGDVGMAMDPVMTCEAPTGARFVVRRSSTSRPPEFHRRCSSGA